ncbi:MAG TPA: hypothetical protein VLH56_14495 [Dissulfurispiraceae bacterium]|nr:hypothetical protein [Dissulfurispiraceae bacterium]
MLRGNVDALGRDVDIAPCQIQQFSASTSCAQGEVDQEFTVEHFERALLLSLDFLQFACSSQQAMTLVIRVNADLLSRDLRPLDVSKRVCLQLPPANRQLEDPFEGLDLLVGSSRAVATIQAGLEKPLAMLVLDGLQVNVPNDINELPHRRIVLLQRGFPDLAIGLLQVIDPELAQLD